MGFLQNAFQDHIRDEHKLEMEEMVSNATKNGSVSSSERSSLCSTGARWYFSEPEINSMIDHAIESHREDFIHYTLPSLIRKACNDSVVSGQERDSIYSKAAVWNVSEEEVNVLLEQGISKRMQQQANAQASKETIVEVASMIGGGVSSVFKGVGGLASKLIDNVGSSPKSKMTSVEAKRALDRLIEDALIDGEISAKEKRTLSDKAFEMGINDDEFEIILNRRIADYKEEHKCQTSPASATPGVPVMPPTSNLTTYMMAVNGAQYGPFNIEQLKTMIPTGQFSQQTLVWTAGMSEWLAASQVLELNTLFAPQMPPVPGSSPQMPPIPGSSPQMPPIPQV